MRVVEIPSRRPGRDGVTVTRIAIEWGFASPSRFSEHYRRQYGETPSDTFERG